MAAGGRYAAVPMSQVPSGIGWTIAQHVGGPGAEEDTTLLNPAGIPRGHIGDSARREISKLPDLMFRTKSS